MPDKLSIDSEFKSLCPALTHDERKHLEESIQNEGVMNPLIVWKNDGRTWLVDGHNRYEICDKTDTPYETKAMEFEDREAVKRWIVSNQLSRRNLTPEATSYLRGKRYNSEKLTASPGRPRKGDQGDRVKTSERLAEEFKVGQATISRDGRFAKAVDAIGENCGKAVISLLLSREVGLTRGQVVKLSKQKETDQKKFIDSIKDQLADHRKNGTRIKFAPPKKRGSKPQTVSLSAKPKEFVDGVVDKFGAAEAIKLAEAIIAAAKAKS